MVLHATSPHRNPRPVRPGVAALLLVLPLALPPAVRAQDRAASTPAAAARPVPPIGFATVAAALADLRARDGNGTVVTESDGWVVINEPPAAAQWSFTPAGHAAHPAVVRRVITRDGRGRPTVHTASLCEAPQAACARLLEDFGALNERITQTARGRAQPEAPR